MKKLLLVTLFFGLFGSNVFSFDRYRQERIDNALTKVELSRFVEKIDDAWPFPESDLTDKKPSKTKKGKLIHPFQYEGGQDKKTVSRLVNEITEGSWSISGGWNFNQMKYSEYSASDSDNVIDEDYGTLNSYYFGAKYKGKNDIHEFLGKPFAELYFRRYEDKILYDGGTSFGPFAHKTNAEVYRYGVKLGAIKDFPTMPGNFFGYFDVGHRHWNRGENELFYDSRHGIYAIKYAEQYMWTYFGFGGGLNYEPFRNFSSGLEFEMMFSGGSFTKMHSDSWGPRGFVNEATYDLGDVWGLEIQLPLKYYILDGKMSFDLTPYFTYWDVERSKPLEMGVDFWYEPDSITHVEGILMGISCFF
ncbi:MAG: hypothetical protein PHV17_00890 [Candidatus Omnitrophica bacterium]|nr:hypothetical protein [Candidatus Omnitrophota bacterium]